MAFTDCTAVSSWPATVNTATPVVELPKLAVTTIDPVDSACIREPEGSTTAVSDDAKLELAVTSYDVAVSSDRYASARADASASDGRARGSRPERVAPMGERLRPSCDENE